MIEYSWEILSLYTKPSENGLNNIVKRVTWTYSAKENAYFASSYFDTNFETADANNFISYSDLTPEIVFGWITSVVDVNEIQNQVNQKLESTKTPESVEKKLPWDRSMNYTGDEEYVLVNNEAVVYGPIKWNSNSFNDQLDKLGFPEDLPVDILAYKQGIVPTNQPLIINETIKIYKCEYIVQVLENNQHLDKSKIFWNLSSGKAKGTYEVVTEIEILPVEKTLEELKEEKINQLKSIFSHKEMNGYIEINVSNELRKFSIRSENLLYYIRKVLTLNDDQTNTFIDFDGKEITLNKNQFLNLTKNIEDYLENYKSIIRQKKQLIISSVSIEELNSINLEIE